jgi:hypothetical protein
VSSVRGADANVSPTEQNQGEHHAQAPSPQRIEKKSIGSSLCRTPASFAPLREAVFIFNAGLLDFESAEGRQPRQMPGFASRDVAVMVGQ